MTTATLPDALSDASRGFAAGPHQHLIGGERSASADGRTFETLDPSTGLAIADVAQGGAGDVDRAVAAAREALDGKWASITPSKRSALMHALADADGAERRRAGRAGVARQREAGRAGKGRGRAPGGRAHPLLRRLAHQDRRPDDPRLPAEHARLLAQGARGRVRPDHPLELPPADGRLEGRSRAGGRLHRGAEARRADPAHRAPPGRAGAGGGHPAPAWSTW